MVEFVRNLEAEPWRFDYFTVLRHLERTYEHRPRIGESAARREEFVQLGQEPFMDFPASNLARVVLDDAKPLKVFVKYLGLLGPQGALPLATTEEAYHYVRAQDDSFPRFLDIFNHRFIQLFFRAWADSRPIVQHDRPKADRFLAYIGSVIGVGSKPYQGLDSVPDAAKLGFAGLIGTQAKCASRLASAICGLFNVRAEVEEFVGSRLVIEASELTTLGRGYNRLGEETLLGRTVFSVQDKIRVRIFTRDLAQYMRFLPTGDLCEPLNDLVFFYNGEQLDWDVELAIPSGSAEPIRIGEFGQLGWTTWMAPNWTSKQAYRRDGRFNPAERMRSKRKHQATAMRKKGGSNGGYQP
ncbi:type VI secretion system baseplate subunit TssG [Bradyrhizobium jicamae]|uniref:type VI secretion system baseplate subunit TssG n=1 Tax=Bradyrhizobium jicamae TaxID=280332 RepID=UPI001BAD427E|nr:type VI secretion system baseplate subunit TssG [Bradyrhizobium jicamae]MBR0936603.1 type VI secretion system baseplate subunit TssG [Bradyrhizobium jicamae]